MICTCLSGYDFELCKQAIHSCEMAEIRLDSMLYDITQIRQLFKFSTIELLATFRPGHTVDALREKALITAIESGAAYIDVESDAPYVGNIVHIAKVHQCKVIISYHNFENTPPVNTLNRIMMQMYAWQPDFLKIVTMAQIPADTLRTLSLYTMEIRLLAFCMGEVGRFSRVASYMLGAPFIYAMPDNGKATADGQFTVSQIRNIMKMLNVE